MKANVGLYLQPFIQPLVERIGLPCLALSPV
jgi:hypothetical protein